jgi:NADPH:quinone reductase-like Zn-dependent oxidoreductase
VQGAGGGLSTALVLLGSAAGLRMWVTSRSEEKRERALAELGADAAFEPGARLPERVDAVMESVGQATWSHSLRSLRPGGKLVVAGATSGPAVDPELPRVFLNQLAIIGVAMGSAAELRALSEFCVEHDVKPAIDSCRPLGEAREAIRKMASGDLFGKVVLDCRSANGS